MTSDSITSDPDIPAGQLLADQLAGVLACAALWLRRSRPVELAAVLVLAGLLSHYVVGPTLAALFTVAVHRPFRTVAAISSLAAGSVLASSLLHPDPEVGIVTSALIGFVLYGGVIGWGMFVRSRRMLLESLRERARRAETEARLRAEHAQRLTRERIAREMHDVLAHRLSLLSVHAGALEYRKDASAEEVAQAAGVIRGSAHAALQDLREVIGVLRAPVGESAGTDGSRTDGSKTTGEKTAGEKTAGLKTAGSETAGWETAGTAVAGASATSASDPGPGAASSGDSTNAEPTRPQPTLAELSRLVEESAQAGMRVELHDRLPAGGALAVPAATGRTAYRIVQEGLTNARKHAPGGAVTVTTDGAAGRGLTVEIRNQTVPAKGGEDGQAAPAIPGSGTGLIGLAERATLAGGRLESGVVGNGHFRLYAWLPWPT
ncbi:sensor histidine kinase [Streptomyces palmae]|uniref:histidine kinase n=2 Tax=Streptomyces palmae TaxID=1701085 RepID=A0A4Z0HB48_9ACTN|nr:sensor histidine kinase [Streptomyces palmae]